MRHIQNQWSGILTDIKAFRDNQNSVKPLHIQPCHIQNTGIVEIHVLCSNTYERVACANKHMCIDTSDNRKKVNFTMWKQRHFTFLYLFYLIIKPF